jgi:poly(3-hydroxybutyrate) depolymerase
MAVYPPGGIANRPLLMAAHGGGGCGPKEIAGWLDLAKRHNFTIACPTFLSGMTNSMYVPMDVPYFKNCLQWVESNLKYDKANVYMTGFSGGGYPVWYLGTTRPDFFRGLFLQSGNFAGDQCYNFDVSRWIDKPIRLVWGAEDSPTVIAQNKQVAALLQSKDLKNFSVEVLAGAHHQPHHDLVVTWMESQTHISSSN